MTAHDKTFTVLGGDWVRHYSAEALAEHPPAFPEDPDDGLAWVSDSSPFARRADLILLALRRWPDPYRAHPENPNKWRAICPVCNAPNFPLTIAERGTGGKVNVGCQSGCSVERIADALQRGPEPPSEPRPEAADPFLVLLLEETIRHEVPPGINALLSAAIGEINRLRDAHDEAVRELETTIDEFEAAATRLEDATGRDA